MDRRKFLNLTATVSGGAIVLPQFLYCSSSVLPSLNSTNSIVFIQLNGGNDGLNTYVPYNDPLYLKYRPKIALNHNKVINKDGDMGFHPSMSGISKIQQDGQLTILQNVGYPNPNRSHFRSQEIWQTASKSTEFIPYGWLGKYLDIQCSDINPTAGVNLDRATNLALKGENPNSITVKDVSKFQNSIDGMEQFGLSQNQSLDFARKVAFSAQDGAVAIQNASKNSKINNNYPSTELGNQLQWISRLIKGNLNSKIYYTSLSGFDTHKNQLGTQRNKLKVLDDALYDFYMDLKNSRLLESTTIVVFSEFGRRVRDNGSGTDHGTAAPMFIIGGNNSGSIIGQNPNLANLDNGDLIYDIDFRSVYASLLQNKLNFDPNLIGIKNKAIKGVF